MWTPGRTVQPPPIEAPSATVTPLTIQSDSRFGLPPGVVARGRLSFNRHEWGPTKTPETQTRSPKQGHPIFELDAIADHDVGVHVHPLGEDAVATDLSAFPHLGFVPDPGSRADGGI